MPTTITVDDREHQLLVALHATVTTLPPGNGIVLAVERLALGDILLHSDGVAILVERKRGDDLMHSRFDGRLQEQGARLRAWQTEQAQTMNAWVVHVIEGQEAARRPYQLGSPARGPAPRPPGGGAPVPITATTSKRRSRCRSRQHRSATT
jgi:ERCC4-type nuclease